MANDIPVKSLSISRNMSIKLSEYADTYNTSESYIMENALKEFFNRHDSEEMLKLSDGTVLTSRKRQIR